MPRNRPGALRARETLGTRPRTREIPQPERIPGLSARTSLAIHHVEQEDGGYFLFPGATERALRRYRRFLRTPGLGILYPRTSVCPSCPGCGLDDVRYARDILDETLSRLPPRPRAELIGAVRALDRGYLLRTLPHPLLRPPLPWWHRRLAEGAEGW
ncbi:hypothetical protein [Streptomyces sp. NPDC050263]|uniref:hypothetical protein n=1 Tax=Streptomyces sp. NPDC050263 TaxID=3155037 RepID=UPI00343F440F